MFGAPKLMPQEADELISFDTMISLFFGVSHRGPSDLSRLPDWRRMEVDELPAPIPPNKSSDAGHPSFRVGPSLWRWSDRSRRPYQNTQKDEVRSGTMKETSIAHHF
jgi:hypothetical protein